MRNTNIDKPLYSSKDVKEFFRDPKTKQSILDDYIDRVDVRKNESPEQYLNRKGIRASEDSESEALMSIQGDIEYEKNRDEWLKNNPGKNEEDFIKTFSLDLVKGFSRELLEDMLKSEYPKIYSTLKDTIKSYSTLDLKRMLDSLDKSGGKIPFSSGGVANGVNAMKRSDFLKLPFSERVSRMFGVSLKGDEKLSEIQMKIRDLKPILILKD